MKIKRFNENDNFTESEEFIDYVMKCFIEHIDAGEEFESEENIFYISINLPWVKHDGRDWICKKPSTIEEMVKYASDLKDFYEDLEVCFKKIKIKYPNSEFKLHYEFESGYIQLGDDETTEDFDSYIMIEVHNK